MHGETGGSDTKTNVVSGPSPCARGNRDLQRGSPNDVRTIPVCTGKPFRNRQNSFFHGDHPRVHGETHPQIPPRFDFDGPSPCARGNLWIENTQASRKPRSKAPLFYRVGLPALSKSLPGTPIVPLVVRQETEAPVPRAQRDPATPLRLQSPPTAQTNPHRHSKCVLEQLCLARTMLYIPGAISSMHDARNPLKRGATLRVTSTVIAIEKILDVVDHVRDCLLLMKCTGRLRSHCMLDAGEFIS